MHYLSSYTNFGGGIPAKGQPHPLVKDLKGREYEVPFLPDILDGQ